MYPQGTGLLAGDVLPIMTMTNDRPFLSSERTPHIDKTASDSNWNLILGPRKGFAQDWPADWPSVVMWVWLWVATARVESQWEPGMTSHMYGMTFSCIVQVSIAIYNLNIYVNFNNTISFELLKLVKNLMFLKDFKMLATRFGPNTRNTQKHNTHNWVSVSINEQSEVTAKR
jgi:hypothetical protein